MVMSIKTYFKKKEVDLSVSGESLKTSGVGAWYPCHVQQKSQDEQTWWNLRPSFVLELPTIMSTTSRQPPEWVPGITGISLEPRKDRKDVQHSAAKSVDVVWDQLQSHFLPNSIKQVFDRYTMLTRKEILATNSFICSIPVVATQKKVVVDCVAVSKQFGAQNNLLWTQVYSPVKATQIVGNVEAVSNLLRWLKSWKENKCSVKWTTKKVKRTNEKDPDFLPNTNDEQGAATAVLLYGPPGSGKTSSVYACAAQEGYQVFEVNTSILRNRSQLLHKLREVSQSHRVQPFSRFTDKSLQLCSNTVILFDEIDLVFPGEYGFLQALQDIISSTKCPVVLTCTDPPKDFHVDVVRLKFSPPSELELAIHCCLLCIANHWPLTLEHSRKLCHHFACDIRKIILHLQLTLTGIPTDPILALQEANGECVASDSSSTTACSLSVNSYRHMYCPWRAGIPKCLPHFSNPSDLDFTALLQEMMSQVDTIQVQQKEKQYIQRPWTSSLQPSLLDEFPDYFPSSCHSGSEIRRTLSQLLYVDSSTTNHSVPDSKSMSNLLIKGANTLDKLFSVLWRTSCTRMVTESLPLLRLMHQNDGLTSGLSRMRQSRHYFYPYHSELCELFT